MLRDWVDSVQHLILELLAGLCRLAVLVALSLAQELVDVGDADAAHLPVPPSPPHRSTGYLNSTISACKSR